MTAVPDFAEIVRQAQQAVRDAGEAYVQVVRIAFSLFSSLSVPTLPAAFSRLDFRLPELPQISTPAEAVDLAYNQAHTVLEIQRGLAKRLPVVSC